MISYRKAIEHVEHKKHWTRFKRFLHDADVTCAYVSNCWLLNNTKNIQQGPSTIDSLRTRFNNVHSEWWLSLAFPWDQAMEGDKYWRELHIQWVNSLFNAQEQV